MMEIKHASILFNLYKILVAVWIRNSREVSEKADVDNLEYASEA
jgi:hypothetical protein